MSAQKKMKWIILAILAGLVAAGGSIAWASPTDATEEVDEASDEPSGSNPGEVDPPLAEPASIPRTPGPRIDTEAKLIGTAVVEGGPSIAFLQLASGTRFVREGDQIVAGMRLVKVWRNRIQVEHAGVYQEISSGWSRGSPAGGYVIPANVDRLWETQGRMGRSLFYSHYRKAQN